MKTRSKSSTTRTTRARSPQWITRQVIAAVLASTSAAASAEAFQPWAHGPVKEQASSRVAVGPEVPPGFAPWYVVGRPAERAGVSGREAAGSVGFQPWS